ncbi:MAG: PEP-CTERM sorting domain-containing protein [Gemmatimonadales bacterium]|nr:PEP-CTERM sorting domain-containing protein [Gemmatimonadales bacterium]
MRFNPRIGALVTATLALLPSVAEASLFGTAVPQAQWAGQTRSTPNLGFGGMTGIVDGNQDYSRNVSIGWTVTFDNLSSLYTYSYSIGLPSRPGLSHLILSLSSDCASQTSTCIASQQIEGGVGATTFGTFQGTGNGGSNPGLPTTVSLFGVKIDLGSGPQSPPLAFTFQSQRAPMWGHFYLKGGRVGAWNNGLVTPSNNVIDYIATPDTRFVPPPPVVIPEPGTVVLMGSGLLGLLAAARRRR